MDNQQLQQLRDLPIEGVAERLGLEIRQHKALCPFHNDHHPSLSFNVRKNTFRCFVCDAHGGTIDLAMRTLHKDFKEACEWLSLTPQPPLLKREGERSPLLLGEGLGVRPFDASRYDFFQITRSAGISRMKLTGGEREKRFTRFTGLRAAGEKRVESFSLIIFNSAVLKA